MDKPESFEIAEYNDVQEPYQTFQTVKQIVQDYKNEHPVVSHSFKVDFIGDLLKITVTLFEMHLPHRLQEVKDMAFKYQKETISYLKKEFKKRTKSELSLKEIKDRSDYTIQKTSLNERYYYICWNVYELDI